MLAFSLCRLWRRTCFLSAVQERARWQYPRLAHPPPWEPKDKAHQINKQTDKQRPPHCRLRAGVPRVSRRPGRQLSYRPSGVDQKVVAPLPSTVSAFRTPWLCPRIAYAPRWSSPSFSSFFGFFSGLRPVGLLVRTHPRRTAVIQLRSWNASASGWRRDPHHLQLPRSGRRRGWPSAHLVPSPLGTSLIMGAATGVVRGVAGAATSTSIRFFFFNHTRIQPYVDYGGALANHIFPSAVPPWYVKHLRAGSVAAPSLPKPLSTLPFPRTPGIEPRV